MPNGTPTGTRVDPYRAYNFKLYIDNAEAHFSQCSGLGIRIPVLSYPEGGNTGVIYRLPGQAEYSDVTLRYGLTDSIDIWKWLTDIMGGKVVRKNVSIAVMKTQGPRAEEAMRWNLLNAWPTEWRGAPLDALCQEVAIETLTLVFEKLERD
ncbi:MAG: phage tail protein [Xenococcaceae cyanobacterium]